MGEPSPSERSSCRHCGLPIANAWRQSGQSAFCCFGCRFAHQLALPAIDGEAESGPASTLLLRLGLGIFLTLNIMVASWLSYSRELFGADATAAGVDSILPALFSYLALFLCTILVAVLGLPLLVGAVELAPNVSGSSRRPALRLNAQALVVVGVLAAYLLSAWHTVVGHGSLYYDTAAVVLVIVALGSYLEAGAKRRAADTASQLLAALPTRLRIQRDDEVVEVTADEVRVGDRVQIRPGETSGVDGIVEEGISRIDEASLTGESRPRAVEAGARVLAGTISLEGQLWVRAERVGHDTVLAQMEHSLAAARAGRPPIQRQADRVAAVFVPAVVMLAVAVLAWSWTQGRPGDGLLRALAILLISCPCALGLAAPLACWHALRRAAENGILIDSAVTLERLAAIDQLFFDKTGTLTRPRASIGQVTTASRLKRRQTLAWAASLESASGHPIATAVLDEAARLDLEVPAVEAARTVPGRGVEGQIEGRLLRFGSRRWLDRSGVDGALLDAPELEGATGEAFLFDERRLLARFDLAEEPRADAASAVAELGAAGVKVGILSGDQEPPTRRLSEALGVPFACGLLPQDKVERLTSARNSGSRIAMVGDGINDAPVLAAADAGIALGSASDLARRSANVRLLGDRLDRVPLLLRIAADTRRRIRANLLWSFGFNSLGIVLATAGRLTPVVAAIAMLLSSATVVRISSGAGRGSATREQEAERGGEFRRPAPDPALITGGARR